MSAGPPDEQTPADSGRQRKQAATVAAVALAGGATVRSAARKAKLGERTLYSWLRKPVFKARVNALRARLVTEAVGHLSKDMTAASGVLRKLLRSETETTRLKAARAILELATKLRESEEMEQRIADLEARLKQ